MSIQPNGEQPRHRDTSAQVSYLGMFKDVLPDGVQVADVRDVADVVGHGLDDDIAGREHQLVGAHLRNDHRSTTRVLQDFIPKEV